MGAGTPQRLPSPCPWPRLAPEEQSEDPGCPSAPPGPWRETSLDGPYGKAKSISAEPGDGETRVSRCCPTSPPAVTSVPISPDCRAGDVAPYRFIPVRSVVLCRQMGSSAPSTPEPAIRRGQCQSLRYGCAVSGDGLLAPMGGWEITHREDGDNSWGGWRWKLIGWLETTHGEAGDGNPQ